MELFTLLSYLANAADIFCLNLINEWKNRENKFYRSRLDLSVEKKIFIFLMFYLVF